MSLVLYGDFSTSEAKWLRLVGWIMPKNDLWSRGYPVQFVRKADILESGQVCSDYAKFKSQISWNSSSHYPIYPKFKHVLVQHKISTTSIPSKSMSQQSSAYFKDWYNTNREKHLAYMKAKLTCECGRQYNRNNLQRHLLTAIHKRWLEKATRGQGV